MFERLNNKLRRRIKIHIAHIYEIYYLDSEENEKRIFNLIIYLQQQGYDALIHQVQGNRIGYICCDSKEYEKLYIEMQEKFEGNIQCTRLQIPMETIVRNLFLDS